MKKLFFKYLHNEKGLGTLEILLIVAVLVAIAIAFREWIIQFVNNIFADVNRADLNDNQLNPGSPPQSNVNH